MAATSDTVCVSCPTSSDAPAGSSSLQNCLCNAGFSGPDGGPCTQCGSGTYKASAGSNACTDCGAGKYSVHVAATSGTTCVECGVGKFSSTTGAGDDSTCTQCTGATFSNLIGASVCMACQEHSTSTGTGTECHCNTGYSLTTGCTVCPIAYYKDFIGNDACTKCLDNHITENPGSSSSSSCKLCNSIKSNSERNGGDECVCAVNYEMSGQSCTLCEGGKHKTERGDHTCVSCPVGKYGDGPTCKSCEKGKYQNQLGQTNCMQIPSNSYTVDANGAKVNGATDFKCNVGYYKNTIQDRCDACPAGKFSNTDISSSTSCTNCAIGKFAQTAAATICTVCGTGKFANDAGFDECLDCSGSCSSNSQYISEDCTASSDSKCADCSCSDSSISNGHGWNYYDGGIHSTCHREDGDVMCNECPEDHWSDNGECKPCSLSNSVRGSGNSCMCKPGYRYEFSYTFSYISGVVENCVPCEAGKYSSYSSKNPFCYECDDCPAGQEMGECNPETGYRTCLYCVVGKYKEAPGIIQIDGNQKCKDCNYDCPAGMENTACGHRGSTTAGSCEYCANGKYKSTSGTHHCLAVCAGHIPISQSTSWSICEAGKYADIHSNTCIQCSPGTYSPTPAAGRCYMPVGCSQSEILNSRSCCDKENQIDVNLWTQTAQGSESEFKCYLHIEPDELFKYSHLGLTHVNGHAEDVIHHQTIYNHYDTSQDINENYYIDANRNWRNNIFFYCQTCPHGKFRLKDSPAECLNCLSGKTKIYSVSNGIRVPTPGLCENCNKLNFCQPMSQLSTQSDKNQLIELETRVAHIIDAVYHGYEQFGVNPNDQKWYYPSTFEDEWSSIVGCDYDGALPRACRLFYDVNECWDVEFDKINDILTYSVSDNLVTHKEFIWPSYGSKFYQAVKPC